ncbi:MAG: hemin uptake protein HemP [Sulfuricurvum sp.]|nr:hemin uptake protein HemP [Sulfuricurvum sp.]
MLNLPTIENCSERTIESKLLLKECTFIRIIHADEVYVLRITKSNKLILTK